MTDATTSSWPVPRSLRSDVAAPAAVALATVLIHLAVVNRYGYFRDELYYMACGEHLDWGYVDFPPLIGVIAWAARGLFGDSLLAIRLLPILAGALIVFLTGLMARALGGGRFAQGLAALAVLVGPTFLANQHFFGVNVFDQLFWTLCGLTLICILKTEDRRLWLVFGVFAGLGLLTKLTMLWFGLAVFVGLLATPARRHLLTPWPWLGGFVAFLFILPHLIWQMQHGWPLLELVTNYAAGTTYQASPLEFLYMQIMTTHPLVLPIWAAGLYYCFALGDGKPYRVFGWVFLFLFVAFMILKTKFYWLSPAYLPLYGAGAVVLERAIQRRRLNWLKPAYPAALVIGGLLMAPLALPILPVDWAVKYHGYLGGDVGVRHERTQIGKLPQHFADMFGWREMVACVSRVYQSLPEAEQTQCVIWTTNFGRAGALDLFGKEYGLPRTICGHNSYFLWGPGDASGEVVIAVGDAREDLEAFFSEVVPTDVVTCEYCMPAESYVPIHLCKRPKISIQEIWPIVKSYP